MYRFLGTPRWLGLAALAVLLSVAMIFLGRWQYDRYEARDQANARVQAARHAAPVPLAQVLPVDGPPPIGAEWTRVSVTGHYDQANEVLVRGRSVNGSVGFEVLTPLRLADGSAVLVDRGWIEPPPGGATQRPQPPAAPAGEQTAVGRLRRPESGATSAVRRDGQLEVRRIVPERIATELGYPLTDAYVLLDETEAGLTAIPSDHQNSLLNIGYAYQWWIFAGMVPVGYWVLARREARRSAELDQDLHDLLDVGTPSDGPRSQTGP